MKSFSHIFGLVTISTRIPLLDSSSMADTDKTCICEVNGTCIRKVVQMVEI